ncbi:hypothetical protein BU17DRAFT_64914 [Hysterangium stoloniferum]|nr:hypothetical protein BU17DRAFT_64914 [Hysterangium stoloniferum]
MSRYVGRGAAFAAANRAQQATRIARAPPHPAPPTGRGACRAQRPSAGVRARITSTGLVASPVVLAEWRVCRVWGKVMVLAAADDAAGGVVVRIPRTLSRM